jgi:hypothetical protein
MTTRLLAIVAVAVILGATLSGGAALAAKGGIKGKPDGNGHGGNGHGNGGNHDPAPTVTLTVDPNPVPAWGHIYTVSGSDFTPGGAVNFVRGGLVTFVAADANGFASTTFQSWDPGTYTVDAYQFSGKKWVLAGSVTFNVV